MGTPSAGPKFQLEDEQSPIAPTTGYTIALLPAGGEMWEEFLETVGVSLERFCAEGPGGWMLGYMDALTRAGVRTVLIFFSAQVERPVRYCDPESGNRIVVLPVPRLYRKLRPFFLTYRGLSAGQSAQSLVSVAAGSVISHLSTPIMALRRELRRERCVALLCQEYEYFRFDICILLGLVQRLPVFATFQGSSRERNLLSAFFKRWTVTRSAGLLIAARGEIKRVRAQYGHRVRVSQIFNPVDTNEWNGSQREEARAAVKAGPETRIAVWHGRIAVYSKGLDLLLSAWEQVCRERPGQDLRLMLMGTGEDAGDFRKQIAERKDLNIHWREEYVTDRSEIRQFLAAGDIYIFPSRLEGFAVAPIEAMACGLPVVAADASGVSEILEEDEKHGGYIVPRESEKALADAIGRFFDDPVRRVELGRRARRRVENAFSLGAVGRDLASAMFSAAIDPPELPRAR